MRNLDKRVIGIDIGGTKCAVVLGANRKEMEIIDRISFPTQVSKGPEYTINKIIDTITEIMDKHRLKIDDISGIGISCGGPLDSNKGVILSPPNLPGWDNIEIVDIMMEKFTLPVGIQNDANACALAEWKFGAARGYSDIVFLTFGTGMGAGMILNGQLYRGASDMAGEVGHVRLDEYGPVGYGKAGSFEGFCSGGGIAQLARIKALEKIQMGENVSFCGDIKGLNNINAKMVFDAAKEGDKLALEICGIVGNYLGKGLSLLIDIINPEMIVIGSIFARAKDLIWPKAREVIEKETLWGTRRVCEVVPAGLGEQIGDYAALGVAVTIHS
jgi:glucokinase